MERRIRSLEERFTPTEAVQLRALSEIAAEGTDLDPALILHESERIPADELVEIMTQLRERWQEMG